MKISRGTKCGYNRAGTLHDPSRFYCCQRHYVTVGALCYWNGIRLSGQARRYKHYANAPSYVTHTSPLKSSAQSDTSGRTRTALDILFKQSSVSIRTSSKTCCQPSSKTCCQPISKTCCQPSSKTCCQPKESKSSYVFNSTL
jgi:hypothetical protein